MNDEFYHFGIKGMKWGIRRYQNKDGSYTPAGKKRYSDETDDKRITSNFKRESRSTYKEKQNEAKRKLQEELKLGKEVYKKTGGFNGNNIAPYKQHGGIVTKWIAKDGTILDSKQMRAGELYWSRVNQRKNNIRTAAIVGSIVAPAVVGAIKNLDTDSISSAVKSGMDFIRTHDFKTIKYDSIEKAFYVRRK